MNKPNYNDQIVSIKHDAEALEESANSFIISNFGTSTSRDEIVVVFK